MMKSKIKHHRISSKVADLTMFSTLVLVTLMNVGLGEASASYKTTCVAWIGTPEKPNSETLPCNLVIVNRNTIIVSGLKMVRISPEVTPFTLTGDWRTDDYNCPDVIGTIAEIVSIVQAGESYIATKVTGDHCVTAGHISFFGRIELDTIVTEIMAGGVLPRL